MSHTKRKETPAQFAISGKGRQTIEPSGNSNGLYGDTSSDSRSTRKRHTFHRETADRIRNAAGRSPDTHHGEHTPAESRHRKTLDARSDSRPRCCPTHKVARAGSPLWPYRTNPRKSSRIEWHIARTARLTFRVVAISERKSGRAR